MMIVGNFKAQDGIDLAQKIADVLGFKSNKYEEAIKSKVAKIEPGQVIEWNSKHVTSNQGESEDESMSGEEAGEDEQSEIDGSEDEEGNGENNSLISVYFQSEYPGNFEELNTIELLESLLEDEFFDVLRTKEQLGYYVSCSQRNTRGIPGLLFTIESSKYTLDVVEPKIFKFIEDYFNEKLTEKVY